MKTNKNLLQLACSGRFQIRRLFGAALLPLLVLLGACQRDDDAAANGRGTVTISRLQVEIEAMGEANTRAATRAFTTDAQGYTGVVKTEFVEGDVIHLIASCPTNANSNNINRYSYATFSDGAWVISPALVLDEEDMIDVFYSGKNEPYKGSDGRLLSAEDVFQALGDCADALPSNDFLIAGNGAGEGFSNISIGTDGTLTLGFVHYSNLVRISSIDNKLGDAYANISSITVNVNRYGGNGTTTVGTAPLTSDTSPGGTGEWQCIVSYGTLTSFTLTFGGSGGVNPVTITIPIKGNDGKGQSINDFGQCHTYRLTLLPGSATATEVDTDGPAWTDARRDPTVPAGYIPIYTVDELQKIGKLASGDYQNNPVYEPAEVNGYTYTTTNDDTGTALTFSLDANYILMADIDLTATPAAGTSAATTRTGDIPDTKWNPEAGTNWKPIGGVDIENTTNPASVIANSAPFTGCFNGNGHTIRGMKISLQLQEISSDAGSAYLGLFGRLSGATIYNLHFKDATVEAKKPDSGNCTSVSAGALAGMTVNSTITLCSATRCQVTGTANIGGLIGNNVNINNSNEKIPSHLTHCYAADCTVKGDNNNGSTYAGGLVGFNKAILVACYTTSCTATAAINIESGTHNVYAGGLAGYSEATTIYGCYAANAMATATTGTSSYAGFLIGCLKIGGNATSCYATTANHSSGSTEVSLLDNPPTTVNASHLIGYIDSSNGATVTACVSPLQNDGEESSPGTTGTDGTAPDSGSGTTGYSGGGYYWGADIGYSPLIDTTGTVPSCTDVRTVISTNGALNVKTCTWTVTGIWGNIPTTAETGSQIPPHIRWSYEGN